MDWRDLVKRVVSETWPELDHGARWIAAQVRQESGGNPEAVSSAGAAGLLQLMPGTARDMGLQVDDSIDERFDPETNVRAGVRYLKMQYEALSEIPNKQDRLFWSFACYNAGRGFIDFDGGVIADTALELAKRDTPEWSQWDVGRYWLMHRNCVVKLRDGRVVHPDYHQVWGYVRGIRSFYVKEFFMEDWK